jgi:hypothetical protein
VTGPKDVTFDVLARAHETGFDKTHDKLKLLGVAAGLMAISFGKDVVGAASDMNESLSKSGVVFGKFAPQVQKWSETSAESFGQSKQQALEAASTFGNFFEAMKIGQPTATKMSEKIVQLAGDLGSFNNVDPAQVLEDLRSGLAGQVEPLRKYGVDLSDVTLKEEAMRLGLVKTTTGTLPVAIKSQAAYSLILKQTKTAQGDFQRTSGGLANQQRILSAEFKNTEASLGKALLPTVTKGTRFAAELAGAFDRNSKVLVPLIGIVGGFALTIFGVNKAMGAWSTSQKVLNAVMNANPILRIITLVILVGTAIVTAYKHSEKFRDVVKTVFADVRIAASLLVRAFYNAFLAPILLVFGAIVHGAAAAFGWVPGLGGKLRTAAHKFDEFKRDVNHAIDSIRGVKKIKVEPDYPSANSTKKWFDGYIKKLSNTFVPVQLGPVVPRSGPSIPGVTHAAGGYLSEGWNRFGEHGVEWGYKRGSQVMVTPTGSSRAPGGGAGAIVLELRSGGSKLDDLLVEIIRRAVRVAGGDVQVVLGRPG